MDDFYIIWDIKKKDWCRYDVAQDRDVQKVIMSYSRVMALAYEKMYLDRGKRKYIAIAMSLSDEAKESIINNYYATAVTTTVVPSSDIVVVAGLDGLSESEGEQLNDGVEYDLFGNIVKKR